jgi:outer membrane protein insertion porin family
MVALMFALMFELMVALPPAVNAQTPSRFVIAQIKVEGNVRLPAAAIAQASGLHLGQTIAPADLDQATARLLGTGMFESARYRYEPTRAPGAKGFDVIFQVAEMGPAMPVEIDIPEIDANLVWQWLQSRYTLLLKQTPTTIPAFTEYERAIERYLKEIGHEQEITHRLEPTPETDRLVVFFRPKTLPIIREIRFQGNQLFDNDALLRPLVKPALGNGFTDYSFRRLLDLNLRPLYEGRGCLAVQFPKVEVENRDGGDGIAVVVTVEEGGVYKLAKVNLDSGDFEPSDLLKAADFPIGKLADAAAIAAGLSRIEDVFRSHGYINVQTDVHRNLNREALTAVLDVKIDSGKQFFFGELILNGLDADSAARARRLWRLERGNPMDGLYLRDYKSKIFEERAVANRKVVTDELKVRPGSDLVDVVLTFR